MSENRKGLIKFKDYKLGYGASFDGFFDCDPEIKKDLSNVIKNLSTIDANICLVSEGTYYEFHSSRLKTALSVEGSTPISSFNHIIKSDNLVHMYQTYGYISLIVKQMSKLNIGKIKLVKISGITFSLDFGVMKISPENLKNGFRRPMRHMIFKPFEYL